MEKKKNRKQMLNILPTQKGKRRMPRNSK